MPVNNANLFDAAYNGCFAGSSERIFNSTNPTNYDIYISCVRAFATAVDGSITPGVFTTGEATLLEDICQGFWASRFPGSSDPAFYTNHVQAVVILWQEARLSLQPIPGGSGQVIFSGGTSSASLSSIVFGNSNGISFGLNGSTMTASVGAGGAAGSISAGTTNVGLGQAVFSNSNGISFGLAGSTLTASFSQSAQTQSTSPAAISAAGSSVSSGTVVFSNSNNVSFGMNGNTITASATASQSTAPGAISAGTTQATSGTVVFSNSNSVSFGMNAGTVTASFSQSAQTQSTSPAAISAAGSSVSSGTVVFSNSNNVSFGMNGNTITATATASQSTAPSAISAGTTQATSGTVVFSNSNGVSFGMNAGTITASVAGAGAAGSISAGTTSVALGQVIFSNSNNITFGLNGSTVTASASAESTAPGAISAGITQATSGTVVFSNSNNISFGMNGNTITGSYALTGDFYDNFRDLAAPNLATSQAFVQQPFNSQNSLLINELGLGIFPFNITASTCMFDVSHSGVGQSVAFTSNLIYGIYTSTGATLSLLNSFSLSFGLTVNANNSTALQGPRFLTVASSLWSSSPVFSSGIKYFFASAWSTSGTAIGSMLGLYRYPFGVQRTGTIGISQTTNTSLGYAPFNGIYSATTGGIPTSIANSELNKVNVNGAANFMPHFQILANTALSAF